MPRRKSNQVNTSNRPLCSLKTSTSKRKALSRSFPSFRLPIMFPWAWRSPQTIMSSSFDLELDKGTVADLLHQFVKAYNQYTWQTVDGVINVFPKESYRDLAMAELLKTRIASFNIGENTSCFRFVDSLLATPEVKNQLAASGISQSGLNFSGGYFPQLGRSFTLDVSDMTLRSILNKVGKGESAGANVGGEEIWHKTGVFYTPSGSP